MIFGIDIVCGDVITPNAIKTTYTTNITEEEIEIYSYNKETILTEKFPNYQPPVFDQYELK